MYSNELYHYGVKGMKWGVRRYQNKSQRVLNKQQKLQRKRFEKWNKLNKSGEKEKANRKYTDMTKREEKLFDRYTKYRDKYLEATANSINLGKAYTDKYTNSTL